MPIRKVTFRPILHNRHRSLQFVAQLPRDVSTMCPIVTEDGRYVLLEEYHSLQDALKVCDARSGALLCCLPISMLSFKLAALAHPPKGALRRQNKFQSEHHKLFCLSFEAASTFVTNKQYRLSVILCTDAGGKYLVATHSETSPSEGIQTCIWELTTGQHVLDVKATTGGISVLKFVPDNRSDSSCTGPFRIIRMSIIRLLHSSTFFRTGLDLCVCVLIGVIIRLLHNSTFSLAKRACRIIQNGPVHVQST